LLPFFSLHIALALLLGESLQSIHLPSAFLLLDRRTVASLWLFLFGDGLVTICHFVVKVKLNFTTDGALPLFFDLKRLEFHVLHLGLILQVDHDADHHQNQAENRLPNLEYCILLLRAG
jgi:hypothetical protein